MENNLAYYGMVTTTITVVKCTDRTTGVIHSHKINGLLNIALAYFYISWKYVTGVTDPKYKLLCFLKTVIFINGRSH